MKTGKTLVLGASENTSRYSNMAVKKLREHGYEVVAVGRRKGQIDAEPVLAEIPADVPFHTVTLYLNPENQEPYRDQILRLHPERVIFNPGTENASFEKELSDHGIHPLRACTLVLLSTGQYGNQG